MKKKVLIICSISLILVLSIFSIVYGETSVSKKNIAEDKVLKDVKREKYVFEEKKEEVIGEYLAYEKEIINEKSKKILDYLQVPSDKIEKVNVVQMGEEKVNRFNESNYQIDFNEEGEIEAIINYNDYSTIDKDRRDYNEEDMVIEIAYQYDSKESIQSIIDELYETLELEGYELVECHNQLMGTWYLLWNNVLDNGVINPFDAVVVSLDAKDGSLKTMYKNKEEPKNTDIKMISQDEAIDFAKPVLKKLRAYDTLNAKLTTVKPNFYWEENGPYECAEIIRIAWKINLDDNKAYIDIDAETGEILGGGETFSEGYRSISSDPTFYCADPATVAAASALQKLGYYQPADCERWNGFVSKETVLNVFAHPKLYGLFFMSHGRGTSEAWALHGSEHANDNRGWFVTVDDLKKINGNWHFVMLTACNSSLYPNVAQALNIYGHSGRGFVGWNEEVDQVHAWEFYSYFFPKLGQMSVMDAINQARDIAGSHNMGCNPGYWGDTDYWGWSW